MNFHRETRSTTVYFCIGFQYSNGRAPARDTPSPSFSLPITYSKRGSTPLFRPRSRFRHHVFFSFVPKFRPAIVPPPSVESIPRGLI